MPSKNASPKIKNRVCQIVFIKKIKTIWSDTYTQKTKEGLGKKLNNGLLLQKENYQINLLFSSISLQTRCFIPSGFN